MLRMAAVVPAVYIAFRRLAAVVTCTDDAPVVSVIDRYSDTLIKNIAQSIPEGPLSFLVLTIGDDSTVELINIGKSIMDHKCRQLLTANTPCAVSKDRLVFFVAKVCTYPFGEFTK